MRILEFIFLPFILHNHFILYLSLPEYLPDDIIRAYDRRLDLRILRIVVLHGETKKYRRHNAQHCNNAADNRFLFHTCFSLSLSSFFCLILVSRLILHRYLILCVYLFTDAYRLYRTLYQKMKYINSAALLDCIH